MIKHFSLLCSAACLNEVLQNDNVDLAVMLFWRNIVAFEKRVKPFLNEQPFANEAAGDCSPSKKVAQSPDHTLDYLLERCGVDSADMIVRARIGSPKDYVQSFLGEWPFTNESTGGCSPNEEAPCFQNYAFDNLVIWPAIF